LNRSSLAGFDSLGDKNEGKKAYYPTRRDEEATNPDRSRLRWFMA
jgi:hypothetical protein